MYGYILTNSRQGDKILASVAFVRDFANPSNLDELFGDVANGGVAVTYLLSNTGDTSWFSIRE
jgi:hypothetical protein